MSSCPSEHRFPAEESLHFLFLPCDRQVRKGIQHGLIVLPLRCGTVIQNADDTDICLRAKVASKSLAQFALHIRNRNGLDMASVRKCSCSARLSRSETEKEGRAESGRIPSRPGNPRLPSRNQPQTARGCALKGYPGNNARLPKAESPVDPSPVYKWFPSENRRETA